MSGFEGKVKRCKVCGIRYRKSHVCQGEKIQSICENCGKHIDSDNLSRHAGKCKGKSAVYCPCGGSFTIGHDHAAEHANTKHHKDWESGDAKERVIGVIYRNKKTTWIDPDEVNPNWREYYKGVMYRARAGYECRRLDELNEKTKDVPDKIHCFCGVRCPRPDYDTHCQRSERHLEWVDTCKEYYDKKAEYNKVESQKRKERRRKKARTESEKSMQIGAKSEASNKRLCVEPLGSLPMEFDSKPIVDGNAKETFHKPLPKIGQEEEKKTKSRRPVNPIEMEATFRHFVDSFCKNSDIVCRKSQYKEISEHFDAKRIVIICGSPGTGKSNLAANVAIDIWYKREPLVVNCENGINFCLAKIKSEITTKKPTLKTGKLEEAELVSAVKTKTAFEKLYD